MKDEGEQAIGRASHDGKGKRREVNRGVRQERGRREGRADE